MPVTYRPMREDDLAAVHEVNRRAFEDLDRRLGTAYPAPAPDPAVALLRLRRLLDSDPGGAWVAERDGAVAGVAMALLREGLWGLSLLVVDPGVQGDGAGRELLALAHAYGDGARGRVILSSSDPRAMRAYARLGLELHPAVARHRRPAGRRDARRTCGPAARTTSRSPRRSTARSAAPPTAPTSLAMLQGGHELLVLPGRGYAMLRGEPGPPARRVRRRRPPAPAARRPGPRRASSARRANVELLTGAPAVGDRRLPRGAAGPAGRLRLRVHWRRRRAVLAVPPERCVSVTRYGSS